MDALVLYLPIRPMSLNMALRQHWATRRKERTAIGWHVKHALGARRWRHEGLVDVTITRSYQGRPMDRDGLYGSIKPVLDALVDAGLLVDDDPRHCRLTVEQVPDSTPWTEVRLEPLTDAHGGTR